MIVLMPFSKNVECGDSKLVNWLEDLLEDIWAMVIRGCMVTVMFLWVYTSNFLVYEHITAPDALTHSSIFWAGFVMFFGAFVCVKLEELEVWAKTKSKKKNQGRIDYATEAFIEYSNLIQNAFAWVAGCAVIDAVTYILPAFYAGPTASVILQNMFWTALLTVVCIFWLVSSGETGDIPEHEATDRSEVEKFFVTNAMGFLIGWLWLLIARDLFTPLGALLEATIESVDASYGLQLDVFGSETGDYVAVFIFCPAFTWFVFWLQNMLTAAYAKGAHLSKMPASQGAAKHESKLAMKAAKHDHTGATVPALV
jgi:hypothetical protein